MTRRYTAAQVGELVGKSENWVRRNASRLPHSRAGRTVFWTDEDVAALMEALRVRPGAPADGGGLRPLTGRRRSA